MLKNSYDDPSQSSEEELATLESLIRDDYERCHPGETLDDLKRRASFSKEDRGLLRDWMTVAAMQQRSRRADVLAALRAGTALTVGEGDHNKS